MPNPVSLLADDADFLISVDIKKELTRHKLDLNIYDILQRSEEVTHYKLSTGLAAKAHHVVHPQGMHYHWAEFNEMDSLVNKGKAAMEKNVEQLRNEIKSYFSYWSWIKRWFGIH